MVLVNLGSVHKDVEHWGDPENFRPERFINSAGKFVKDDHLILFGTGYKFWSRK
jgi:methyl farnesoate epoxidase / farnesoate epoxidase